MMTAARENSGPLVSVIMPAYNAAEYIAEAIASVQAQTVQDWELIVVDDCSTDDTVDVIRKYAAEDERIKPIFSPENRGVAAARNTGLDHVSGRYVALLDSDDLWRPRKLEMQLSVATEREADIIYCSYSMIDGSGRKCLPDFIVEETASFNSLLTRSVISCSTALFTRDTADVYRFSNEYYHEDYVMWLQMLRDGRKAVGVTEVLADYRLNPDSRAGNKLKSAVHRWNIYRKFLRYSPVHSAFVMMMYAWKGFMKYRRRGSLRQ